MSESSFFNLGVKLAAAVRNRDSHNIISLTGLTSTVDNPKEANYGYLQKFVCKVAADAFSEAGRKTDMEYHIFEKLARAPIWYPEFDLFSNAAFSALGKIADAYEQETKQANNDAIVKQANPIAGLLTAFGKSTPEMMATAAGAGALGGGITGGLYWLLNRHSQEDEDEAEVMKAKINYYNKISDEIKRQLGTKKLPPAEIAARVQEIVKQDNLF